MHLPAILPSKKRADTAQKTSSKMNAAAQNMIDDEFVSSRGYVVIQLGSPVSSSHWKSNGYTGRKSSDPGIIAAASL